MIQFNGTTQELASVANVTPPTPAGTLSFWLNLPTIGPPGYIMGMSLNWAVRMLGANLTLNLLRATSKPMVVANPFTANTWHHVVAAYLWNGATKTDITCYIDGVSYGTDNDNDGAQVAAIQYLASVGGAGFMPCRLADFRIYNRQLSENEILTIHACRGVDGIVSGMTHRWLMKEGAEGVAATGAGAVKDLIGGVNMTPANSPTWQADPLRSRRMV